MNVAAIRQKKIDELVKDLREHLAIYRFKNQLTLKQMGDKAGVSYPIITLIEVGPIRNIGVDKILQIANAIGYTVDFTFNSVN